MTKICPGNINKVGEVTSIMLKRSTRLTRLRRPRVHVNENSKVCEVNEIGEACSDDNDKGVGEAATLTSALEVDQISEVNGIFEVDEATDQRGTHGRRVQRVQRGKRSKSPGSAKCVMWTRSTNVGEVDEVSYVGVVNQIS